MQILDRNHESTSLKYKRFFTMGESVSSVQCLKSVVNLSVNYL